MSWWDRRKQANEKRYLQAWEKRRRMGFLGFVLVWGVGAWGLTSGVLSMTALMVIEGANHPQQPWGWGKMGVWLLGVFAFAAGGVWWGAVAWWWLEREYRRLMRKHGRQPAPPGTGDPDAK